MSLTSEEKLDKVYEFCIRLEPFIKDLEDLKKWAFIGNGVPAAKTQLYILWACFLGYLGYLGLAH